MRILVAHNVDRRRAGGMSRIMEYIHDDVVAEGHAVDWLSAEDVPPMWRGKASRLAFPWLVWQRAREAARRGQPYDLVNVHEPHSMLISLAQRSVTRFGVVVTSHGLERRAWDLAIEDGRRGRGGPSLRSRILYPATSLWQSRVGLTRARLVLTLNEQDRDYLISNLGLPPARVGRMRPGASGIFLNAAAHRTYDSGHRLLFAGTWRTNKGIADLAAAFAIVASRHSAVSLTVLGAGVSASVVTQSFPESIRNRVTVISTANDITAARTLAEADIFVLPSLFEGTPLTLIEAMMSGLPVVTTDVCGMRDVIRHERNGLLVPPHSPSDIAAAIERLLGSVTLRQSLGRRAHRYARKHHNWRTVAREVICAYQRLTQNP